jgi:flavin-dependent dehydrogenase
MQKKVLFNFFAVLSFFYSNCNPGIINQGEYIIQSQRNIPVIESVDIVIIGGTTAAVSAAVKASEQGAKVYLVAPKPYLGEDMCATLRLSIDEKRTLKTAIEKKIFDNRLYAEPLDVKATLCEELINAQVKFVFSSYVTDILWNNDNKPSGVVISNRAGRQAVISKIIVDATDRGWVCRMAGAEAYPWNDDEIEFERTVIMPGLNGEVSRNVIHKLNIPMPDLHFSSFAKAEQAAIDKTYSPGQLRASESLFHIPPDPIICKKNASAWKNNSESYFDHFQPKGFDNLIVLSGSADIPGNLADSLLQPAAMTEIAGIIGQLTAVRAIQNQMPQHVFLIGDARGFVSKGDVKEILKGLRPINNYNETIKSPETCIPVFAHYDVVVVGGGTSGAPAAISAARRGMKVLVIEYLEGLGGIGTLGMIGKPYHGINKGFASEVPFPEDNIEPKMEWYRKEILNAGGEIWLGVLGCGAYLNGNRVKGVVVSTPEGRGIIKADAVIDATGNADIAIAAGAEYMYGDIEKDDIALQGTGLGDRPLTGNYFNSDYLIVDETDMIDIWSTIVSVHITKAYENRYDVVPVIQNRERRRIIGDYVLNYLDQIAGRTFPDAVVYSGSDYDSHGYPSSEYFALLPHDEISRKKNHPAPGGSCFTPYRCLLPKNLDGIIVTGTAISMDRDASAMVRMQFDLANQGYAAGVAAMLAVKNKINLREINIKELQKILIEKGNLPDSVLYLKDSFPLSKEIINDAVKLYGEASNPVNAGKPLAIILSHRDTSIPIIKKAYQRADGRSKLLFAQVLGMCGQKTGVSVLKAEMKKFKEWDEKIYQGIGADYAHLPTPMDAVILSLGYSGDKTVLPLLLNLVDKLDHNVTLSHHRSIALALERLADPSAALSLAKLLQKPEMQGHAINSIEDALKEIDYEGGRKPGVSPKDQYPKRTRALREIVLARALYKCGDYDGLGKKILESYKNDNRGLFSRHAYHVLNK